MLQKDLSETQPKVQTEHEARIHNAYFFVELIGRIAQQSPKAVPTSNNAAQSRLNRRNNAKQIQIKKRNSLISATRIFNGVDGAPRIVAIIPLTEDVSTKSIVASLADSLDISGTECPEDGLWKMRCASFAKKKSTEGC